MFASQSNSRSDQASGGRLAATPRASASAAAQRIALPEFAVWLSDWNPPAEPIAAVAFDMDGTTFDSEPLHQHCHRVLLAELVGQQINSDDQLWRELTMGERRFARQGKVWFRADPEVAELLFARLTHLDLAPGIAVDEYVERKTKLLLKLIESRDKLPDMLPGVKELISELSAAKVPLGVCTGGSTTRVVEALLRAYEMQGFFSALVSTDNLAGHPGKPDPHLYNEVFRELAPAEGLRCALEDSPGGAASARGAGACCFLRLSHHKLDDAIRGLQEIVEAGSMQQRHPIVILDEPHGSWSQLGARLRPLISAEH